MNETFLFDARQPRHKTEVTTHCTRPSFEEECAHRTGWELFHVTVRELKNPPLTQIWAIWKGIVIE